jgi:hypothetical protein
MRKVMKKHIVFATVGALVLTGLIVAFKSNAAGPGSSANGHGTLLVQDESGNTVRRQFSFSARSQTGGTTAGNAVLHNPAFTVSNGQRYQLQVEVSCMKIIGNVVFFGGLTRRTNDPNLVDAVYFSVQDNGEPGQNRDKISRVFFFDDDPNTMGDPQLCQFNELGDFPMETIDGGNVQVKP